MSPKRKRTCDDEEKEGKLQEDHRSRRSSRRRCVNTNIDYSKHEEYLDALIGVSEREAGKKGFFSSRYAKLKQKPDILRWRKKLERLSPARLIQEDPWLHPADLYAALLKDGFRRPCVISHAACGSVEQTRDALGLHLPLDVLTPRGLVDALDTDVTVPTFDVTNQRSGPHMTMKELAHYHSLPPEKRERLINVVSLSLASTDLADRIRVPAAVTQLDLVEKCWPKDIEPRPETLHYILIGPQGAYTDWHVDMGGSSVWYHVIKGHKVFMLAPPTQKNMEAYENWASSESQTAVFLGDELEDCHRAILKTGDTLFLPGGWIHAVSTPRDSFVIGGNFLHSLNFKTLADVHNQELKLGVTPKYQYPLFRDLMWFVALNLCDRLQQGIDNLTDWELEGAPNLCKLLHQWLEETQHRKPFRLGAATNLNVDPEKLILEIESLSSKNPTSLDSSISTENRQNFKDLKDDECIQDETNISQNQMNSNIGTYDAQDYIENAIKDHDPSLHQEEGYIKDISRNVQCHNGNGYETQCGDMNQLIHDLDLASSFTNMTWKTAAETETFRAQFSWTGSTINNYVNEISVALNSLKKLQETIEILNLLLRLSRKGILTLNIEEHFILQNLILLRQRFKDLSDHAEQLACRIIHGPEVYPRHMEMSNVMDVIDNLYVPSRKEDLDLMKIIEVARLLQQNQIDGQML